ncbi:MAG: Lrp/AsnC family transcriptional regulator [Proteobacteria bacterium]|nr:Lrp/AsnC family transcriptional regulator [Pseudomonadota bacterium]
MRLDSFDLALLKELTREGRASHVEIADRIGLSSTASARRLKAMEEAGLIKGYSAALDLNRFGLGVTVLVRITLESQSEEVLEAFEREVVKCPWVVRCFLMSGSDDYLVTVQVRDIADFEHIHKTHLSRLPRVARMQSSFALREVINRAIPPAIFDQRVTHK